MKNIIVMIRAMRPSFVLLWFYRRRCGFMDFDSKEEYLRDIDTVLDSMLKHPKDVTARERMSLSRILPGG